MKYKVAGVTLLLVVASAALGASAFTSGTVERTSNVNVVNDDTGLLALEDGTSGNLVFQNSSGGLEIDFTNGSADGVNVESRYVLGDTSNAANQYAFNFTNNDAESHDITFKYTEPTADSNTDDNIQFKVYNSSGGLVTTVTDESTSQTINGVGPAESHNVVLIVDTHGLDSSADLSGTLEVSV